VIRGNVFFEVEKIEQLALINRLTTHHDLRPSLKSFRRRNHDSPIFTRTFSTASVKLRIRGRAMARPVYLQQRTYLVTAGTAVECRVCSLIPGFGVKLSAIILSGPTVLSAVGACPPHDGVRRRWWI